MFERVDFLAGLDLEPLGGGSGGSGQSFRAPNMDYYGKSSSAAAGAVSDVISGGQVLAQAVATAKALQPDKSTKSVHAVFARPGRVSEALVVRTHTVQDGRTTGTIVVHFEQGDRAFATATVLTHAPDADVIRHGAPAPAGLEPPPADASEGRQGFLDLVEPPAEPGVPGQPLPARKLLWVRSPSPSPSPSQGSGDDEALGQAILAFATNFYLVEVAMRPHAELSIDQSHLKVSTGVLSHTISFHEPFDASRWLLLDLDAPYAGRGRFFGRGHAFGDDGTLVASFVQDGLIRSLGPSQGKGASL